MNTLLIILAAVVFGGIVWLLLQKRDYSVKREQVLNAPVERAFSYVQDFRNWPAWSPWLMHEPDCRLDYSKATEVGGGYSWDGKFVGAGSMQHQAIEHNKSMAMQIKFLRPFKSVAKVNWQFQPIDADSCKVIWSFSGKLPFYLSWMRQMLEKMLGMDYQMGLALLAGQLDPQCEHPQLEFVGECQLEPQPAIKHDYSGSFAQIGAVSQQTFPQLLQQAGDRLAGMPMIVYHKVDLKKQTTVCSMAVPVNSLDKDEASLQVPGGKYFKVRLSGSYEFLELAWYSAINHLRMRKIKWLKKQPTLEAYPNDPRQVKSNNELVTELLVPLVP